jgi:hypothetical protein
MPSTHSSHTQFMNTLSDEWIVRTGSCKLIRPCYTQGIFSCSDIPPTAPHSSIAVPPMLEIFNGRAVAQVVSRRLPTEKARVRVRVRSSGFCAGQSGTGAGFFRVLGFPLPSIPPTAPHSSSSIIIIRGWYK